jgi:hypothetical protein
VSCRPVSPGREKPISASSVTQLSAHQPTYILAKFRFHRYINPWYIILIRSHFQLNPPVHASPSLRGCGDNVPLYGTMITGLTCTPCFNIQKLCIFPRLLTAQAVRHWISTAQPRVQSWVYSCEIRVNEVALKWEFLWLSLAVFCYLSSHHCSILICHSPLSCETAFFRSTLSHPRCLSPGLHLQQGTWLLTK